MMRKFVVFMDRRHAFSNRHRDHEPRRSGVSGKRRWKWFRGLAPLCRDAATERRFMERLVRTMPLFLALGVTTPSAPAQTGVPTATNAPAQRPPAPRRPNIILIVADDLGYG